MIILGAILLSLGILAFAWWYDEWSWAREMRKFNEKVKAEQAKESIKNAYEFGLQEGKLRAQCPNYAKFREMPEVQPVRHVVEEEDSGVNLLLVPVVLGAEHGFNYPDAPPAFEGGGGDFGGAGASADYSSDSSSSSSCDSSSSSDSSYDSGSSCDSSPSSGGD